MKNTLTLFFSLLTISTFAQDTEQPKARLGFKAQPVFSWMSFDSKGFKSNGAKVGGKFGLVADIRIGKNYAFSTGLDFLMMGGKATISDSVYKVSMVGAVSDTILLSSRNYKFQYIEIPLGFKLKTNQIGYFTYFVQFGGAIGVNISSKAEDEGTSLSTLKADYKETAPLKTGLASGSEVKLIRAEVNVGIGAEWAIQGNLGLMFGVSYHRGLTNALNGSNETLKQIVTTTNGTQYPAITQRAKNDYVTLNIALLF